MTTFLIIAVVVIIVLVLGLMFWPSSYYKTIFAEEHRRLVHEWIVQNINRDVVLDVNEGAKLTTEAGLNLYMTKSFDDEDGWLLHLSISEVRGYTTGAVGSAYGNLIRSTVQANDHMSYRVNPDSPVRHLVLQSDREQFQTRPFEAALEASTLAEHMDFPIQELISEV